MNNLVITNNPLIKDKINGKAEVDYRDVGAADILDAVSKEVEKGARLREDPKRDLKKYYKSVVLLKGEDEINEANKVMIDVAVEAIRGIEPKKPSREGAAQKKDLEKVMQILR